MGIRGPLRAPGLLRGRLTYHLGGRPASMTFYFTWPTTITQSTTDELADALIAWDKGGEILPSGFWLLRISSSILVESRVESLDKTSTAITIRSGLFQGGAAPSIYFRSIATTLAPLVYWRTDPERPYRGRTYVCGLADINSISGSDTVYLDGLARDAITAAFADLRVQLIALGFEQVLVEAQRGGARLDPVQVYTVTDCYMLNERMATQRRRTRPRGLALVGTD